MAELELVRTDARTYTLGDAGVLRLEGFLGRTATAELNAGRLRFVTRGWFSPRTEAIDEPGEVVGTFEPAALRRGGNLVWKGARLSLRAASAWRERYALADDDDELAVFDARGWGKRPVRITTNDQEDIADGLLLFAAFVTRRLAEDANTAAGAAASTAATSG